MAAAKILALIAFSACVHVSQQCYTVQCEHHEQDLINCIGGQWTCAADEYCQVETDTTHGHGHGNNPWHILNCRPLGTMDDCLSFYQTNNPSCDPNSHDYVCAWCCLDHQCVSDLANGNYSPPDMPSLPPPTTDLGTTDTSESVPVQSQAPDNNPQTTVIPPDHTTPATATQCGDLYLGDCAADFPGRCNEPLVQQLCPAFCGRC